MATDHTSAADRGKGWTTDQLTVIAAADDLHIAPDRPPGAARGGVPGTPTWIWSVAVKDAVYVRPYNGAASSWYQSATTTGTGIITTGGTTYRVAFTPADPHLEDQVDRAYREKYAGSPYLPPMLRDGPRSTTLRVTPAS